MPSTGLVWFRRDLRVHDHPPLARAVRECDRVLCVFVLDQRLIHGRFPSAARLEFLLASLHELRESIRARGGELVVREGRPEQVLPELAAAVGAERAYFASDVSPFARGRDERVEQALRTAGVRPCRSGGNFVADTRAPRTGGGRPYVVFTPFQRQWDAAPRRRVEAAPRAIPGPATPNAGRIPGLAHFGLEREVPNAHPAGEAAARRRLHAWLRDGIAGYASGGAATDMVSGSSQLSMHLHFGTISAREAEESGRAAGGAGAAAWVRQLCWRDFYAHVLYHHPHNALGAHKPQFDALEWSADEDALAAWKCGCTGYPIVDAGMRELAQTGFMHNRARLIVASFLTKDLHLDWRAGEAHFMRYLLCGDEAQNNGNWQWIAGTGVDPQPFFKRLYNPILQQQRHDPHGAYVRRWVPELAAVPLERLAQPWTMSPAEQRAAGCEIGRDYPEPIVDHAAERRRAIARYAAVSKG